MRYQDEDGTYYDICRSCHQGMSDEEVHKELGLLGQDVFAWTEEGEVREAEEVYQIVIDEGNPYTCDICNRELRLSDARPAR